MRQDIMKWSYEAQDIRTKVDVEEQVWFAGIDICNILGYADSHATITKLDEDERRLDRLRDGQGKLKDTLTVNEFGLYSLILTSTKPEAKAFKRWVTHEVLPSIRRACQYTTEEAQSKELELQRLEKSVESKEYEITDTKSKLKTLTGDRDNLVLQLRDIIRRTPGQLSFELPAE